MICFYDIKKKNKFVERIEIKVINKIFYLINHTLINNKCINNSEIITIDEAFYRSLAHNCKHKEHKEVKIYQKMLAVNQLTSWHKKMEK